MDYNDTRDNIKWLFDRVDMNRFTKAEELQEYYRIKELYEL